MDKLDKISGFLGKYMAIIILSVALISLFFPNYFLFIKTSYINYFLMVIMFGMGLTLKGEDFILVFSRPKEIIAGSITQYLIMPTLALVLCILFHLDSADRTAISGGGEIICGCARGRRRRSFYRWTLGGDPPFRSGGVLRFLLASYERKKELKHGFSGGGEDVYFSFIQLYSVSGAFAADGIVGLDFL